MTDDQRLAAFNDRRARLEALSDEALRDRFWELTHELVQPIVTLARTHTSPSIERSVLLRMGVDSISSHAVVDRINEAGLLGKGAGHVLVRLADREGLDVREAASALIEDPSLLAGLFAAPATTASARTASGSEATA